MLGSPEPDPPPQAAAEQDRRQEARQITVRLVAKLRTPLREELCLVRNLSSGGLTTHIYSAIDADCAVTFEFASGVVIAGKIVWQRDTMAGVQFDEQIDPALILSVRERFPDAPAPRAPRVELTIPATARIEGVHFPITLNNISQGGAQIRADEPIDAGEKLTLLVDGLPPATGRVRWSRDDIAGIAFHVPLPFDILAQWLPMVQSSPEAAGESSESA
jgi:hypothetical protein